MMKTLASYIHIDVFYPLLSSLAILISTAMSDFVLGGFDFGF